MRGPVFQQAVVIGRRPLTPTAIGVVAGLVRQHREIVLIEVDQAVRIFAQVFRPVHAKQRTEAWLTAGDGSALIASVSVTTRNGGPADDEFWRRPADGSTPPPPAPPPTGPATPEYPGPPPSAPPPRGWRPPVVMQPAAPRELPRQDSEGIEEEERSARTLTYGIGMIAAAVLVIVVCLLCSRALF